MAEFLVDAALRTNPKFRDLAKRLAGNSNAAWALIRLWSFTASNRPDGDLTGIDPAEVPLTEIEWSSLQEARGPKSVHGFVKISGEVVTLHNWDRSGKHQTALQRRQAAARKAGIASVKARLEQHALDFKATRALLVGTKIQGESEEAFEARAKDATAKLMTNVSPLTEISQSTERWLDEGFEWFYSIYPKHEGRFEGRKAWGKLHRVLLVSDGCKGITIALKKRMFEFIQGKLRSGDWEISPDKKKYIPSPAVFLNQRRWEE